MRAAWYGPALGCIDIVKWDLQAYKESLPRMSSSQDTVLGFMAFVTCDLQAYKESLWRMTSSQDSFLGDMAFINCDQLALICLHNLSLSWTNFTPRMNKLWKIHNILQIKKLWMEILHIWQFFQTQTLDIGILLNINIDDKFGHNVMF